MAASKPTLYDAKADGAPVLAIAGQVSSGEVGRDYFQEIKLEQMFEDVAVFNREVHSAESLPDLLNQAIRTAYSKKGVAVLSVSDDLFAEKIKREPVYIHQCILKGTLNRKKNSSSPAPNILITLRSRLSWQGRE